jgi:hypothetical protein
MLYKKSPLSYVNYKMYNMWVKPMDFAEKPDLHEVTIELRRVKQAI